MPTMQIFGRVLLALLFLVLLWLIYTVLPTKKNRAAWRKSTATHRHYKGGYYKVIQYHVRHTETREYMVVYQHVWPHEPGEWQARPAENFLGYTADGQRRFEPLGERPRLE